MSPPPSKSGMLAVMAGLLVVPAAAQAADAPTTTTSASSATTSTTTSPTPPAGTTTTKTTVTDPTPTPDPVTKTTTTTAAPPTTTEAGPATPSAESPRPETKGGSEAPAGGATGTAPKSAGAEDAVGGDGGGVRRTTAHRAELRRQAQAKRQAKEQAKKQAQANKHTKKKHKKAKKKDAATAQDAANGTAANDRDAVTGGADELIPPPSAVPNFFIDQFQIPPFLLPIYQAAGIQYGIRWEILAAINEIETNYGRNLSVSTAGALGWMQFMPPTWASYGVDANGDEKADPYNPVDAIFAAARYLKAAGGDDDIRKAIFAYNHADWYVDSVLMRARLISGLPDDLVGSLTGLTQGIFPVTGDASYPGMPTGKDAKGTAPADAAGGATQESDAKRRAIEISTEPGSSAVAVQDGTIVGLGENDKLGKYVKLRDVYGNRYTYAHLDAIAETYPAPAADPQDTEEDASRDAPRDPAPTAAATAGRQVATPAPTASPAATDEGASAPTTGPTATDGDRSADRTFATPPAPTATVPGDLSATDPATTPPATPDPATEAPADSGTVQLRPLVRGAQVTGGTVLGTVGQAPAADAVTGTPVPDAKMGFEIRPAGKGAPRIDPKPILDGWKLLESSSVYRAKGSSGDALFGGTGGFNASAGQVLLMSKAQLQRRALTDERLTLYPAGREQVKAGLVDRRILATLEYLTASGQRIAVSSLARPGAITTSGNVSEHNSGNAVDIASVDGKTITPAAQGAGSITERTIRLLLQLQGTMKPHQIISLMPASDFGGADNVMALPDHGDHIHVGFHVTQSSDPKLGRQLASALKPGQWDTLIKRLNTIENPTVSATPSKYALKLKTKTPKAK